jgi:hypothetical protein
MSVRLTKGTISHHCDAQLATCFQQPKLLDFKRERRVLHLHTVYRVDGVRSSKRRFGDFGEADVLDLSLAVNEVKVSGD